MSGIKLGIVFLLLVLTTSTHALSYDECIEARFPERGMTSELEGYVKKLEAGDDVNLHSWWDCVQLCCENMQGW